MSIVEKMLEASNKTRRHLDPTGSMRMEAALKALLTAKRGIPCEPCSASRGEEVA